MVRITAKLLGLGALAIVICATASTAGGSKIEPRLQAVLDALGPDEEVAIIIDFRGSVEVGRDREQHADEPRSELIKALKAEADRIQGPVTALLERSGLTGAKQLWLSNQMAVTVPASLVQELAEQSEVEQIKLDAEVVIPLAPGTTESREPRPADPDTATRTATDQAAQSRAMTPSPPAGLRSAARTQTTVTLEWDAPVDQVGVYRLYELIPVNRFRSHWRPKVDTIAALSTVVRELEPGSRHEYAVSALDEEGRESERSAGISVTTLRRPVAYHPVHRSNRPVAAIVGESFKYNVDAEGVPPPTFLLRAGPDTMQVDPGSGVVQWTPGPGDEGTVNATVRASNSEGTDDHAFSILVHPAGSDLEAPGSVRAVVVRDPTPLGATLTWKPATDNVAVAGYRVLAQRFGRGNRLFPAGDRPAPETSLTISTLEPGHRYRVWVQPYDSAGNAASISGVPPAHITTLPQPAERPPPPTGP